MLFLVDFYSKSGKFFYTKLIYRTQAKFGASFELFLTSILCSNCSLKRWGSLQKIKFKRLQSKQAEYCFGKNLNSLIFIVKKWQNFFYIKINLQNLKLNLEPLLNYFLLGILSNNRPQEKGPPSKIKSKLAKSCFEITQFPLFCKINSGKFNFLGFLTYILCSD